MFKRSIAVVLALALMLSLCCTLAAADEAKPLEGVTLKLWKPLWWSSALPSESDNLAWQEVQNRLGVTLDIVSPTLGSEQEQFNLLMAGGKLPDIIYTDWSGFGLYTGGLDKYVDEGVLVNFADDVATLAPDYLYCIQNYVPEDEQKEFYTDSGYMCQFYAISPYEEYCYNGLLFRKDWMDQLGLDRPKTMDDVETALTRFKDELGAEYPMIFPVNGVDGLGGVFVAAYGIGPSFYQEDGVVKYGPIQEGWKEYLAKMNDWYNKGLIDPDFPARDEDAYKRMLTTGQSGALIHSPDTTGAWMTGITDMLGSYSPVLNEGDTIEFRLKTFACRPPYCAGITMDCENYEAAMTFLNYGYTEDGWMLYNYGVEGDTYNMVDGKAVFTDKMVNNPEYNNMLDTIALYKHHIGPFLRFEHESNPTINEANMTTRQLWTESAGTALCLPYTTMTSDEGTEYASIMSQVQTYVDTATVNFITGKASLDTFDSYVSDIMNLKIERAIEIQQAALDRYNAR